MYKRKPILLPLFILISFSTVLCAQGEVIYREAKNTLTPIEMNIGDTLKFKLKNGEVRSMILEETAADVVITNLNQLKTDQPGGGTLYRFTSNISIDGHSMKMERYVGSQESFYEPYVINGMRIWFDGVSDISEVINQERGGKDSEAKPNKDARFAIMDMSDRISPSQLYSWYKNKEDFLDIRDSYNGDDSWMGAYNGFAAHGGLDINMPKGSPNFTPFPIDDHYFFNSLAEGDNNNRWRGWHQWENGDVWTIQNHHMLNLLIPEHVPIKPGVHYADAAGVRLGDHAHVHYVFRIKTPENETEILLDPWIILWQIFEDNKEKSGKINAAMAPLGPGETGIPVHFISDGSSSGRNDSEMTYYWTFGDGGFSDQANPQYTFMKRGIYPVSLVIDDGAQKSSFTQHITIDGAKVDDPGLTLMGVDEPSFRLRPVKVMDVYGVPVQMTPHSLHFIARSSRPEPNDKIIKLKNSGSGVLTGTIESRIFYSEEVKEWLTVKHQGENNDQQLNVAVDATGLSTGKYSARVEVELPGAVNGNQSFSVQLIIPTHPPAHRATRDLRQEIIDKIIPMKDNIAFTVHLIFG